MTTPLSFPHFVLNRLSYGPRPEDVTAFLALGRTSTERLFAYLDQQLDYTRINDSALEGRLSRANFKTLHLTLQQQWQGYHPRGSVKDNGDPKTPGYEVQCATITRALYSKRQLFERMASFWHEHFNVCAIARETGPVYVDYDRTIRAHALGNFRAMLEATAKSAAMLQFLDNASNGNPSLIPGKGRVNQINENYARELMELHTLGAEHYFGAVQQSKIPRLSGTTIAAGYCESDVIGVAKAFSGWGIHDGRDGDTKKDGTFFYRKGGIAGNARSWHIAGPKQAFGRVFQSNVDLVEGRQILDWLAFHPNTANRICEKLCRRFVSDTAPAGLVQRAAKVFLQQKTNPLQLQHVLLTILTSPEFTNSAGLKTKRPLHWAISAARATGFDLTIKSYKTSSTTQADRDSDAFRLKLDDAGDMPHAWQTPEGPPDIATPWLGTSAMVYSMRFNTWLTDALDSQQRPLAPIYRITTDTLPKGGLGGTKQTARAVVDFWWKRLIGTTGSAIGYDSYNAVLAFLAQNRDANTYLFDWADNSKRSTARNPDASEDYNQSRLRTAVAMMLNSRAFLLQG